MTSNELLAKYNVWTVFFNSCYEGAYLCRIIRDEKGNKDVKLYNDVCFPLKKVLLYIKSKDMLDLIKQQLEGTISSGDFNAKALAIISSIENPTEEVLEANEMQ